MTEHGLHDQLPPPQRTPGTPTAEWAAWVREQWSAVRVILVEATHLADAADRVRVRAVIHLGSLSPADVRVDAVAGAAEPAGDPAHRPSELWCAQSYRNGTFVFEGFAATEGDEEQPTLTARVRPRAADENLAPLSVVAHSTDERPDPTAATRVDVERSADGARESGSDRGSA
jgi:hypothetical protein